MLSKQAIRQKFVERRTSLSAENIRESSLRVARQVLDLPDWEHIHRIHMYSSKVGWGEVDTAWLRHALQQRYPQLNIESSISSPEAQVPTNQYDCIIVPVLAFDATGYRLGLGKGWYDRFLATQPQALKIGLAYGWAQLTTLPHESYDVPLDKIVTEQKIIERSITPPEDSSRS